jgi:integrase
VQYTTWQDIDFEKQELHIRAKLDVGFTPKNHEKRSVPIPGSLVKLLKERKKTGTGTRFRSGWGFSLPAVESRCIRGCVSYGPVRKLIKK